MALGRTYSPGAQGLHVGTGAPLPPARPRVRTTMAAIQPRTMIHGTGSSRLIAASVYHD